MMQSLFAEPFKLAVHFEIKEGPAVIFAFILLTTPKNAQNQQASAAIQNKIKQIESDMNNERTQLSENTSHSVPRFAAYFCNEASADGR